MGGGSEGRNSGENRLSRLERSIRVKDGRQLYVLLLLLRPLPFLPEKKTFISLILFLAQREGKKGNRKK